MFDDVTTVPGSNRQAILLRAEGVAPSAVKAFGWDGTEAILLRWPGAWAPETNLPAEQLCRVR
jgi:hypothetical protein